MTSTSTAPATQITYVIPCSAGKLDHPAAARDLYTGPMFRHTLAAARSAAATDASAQILVLSAKYGLVGLDETLAPYDQKMGQPGSVTPFALATQALAWGINWGSDVYTFLPATYYAPLNEALRMLDVYPQDVYEAAPGIGYQRGVNRCVTQY